MPAFTSTIDGGGDRQLEDQRALQVALELSLLNFDGTNSMEHMASLHYAEEMRYLAKKSQNMTECVPVPSSEHVAEIVGRQGCKIKALRAKTNTYIKTPVRGEEPVFVVTGRKEDVGAAKREILSAADHFSQIRASRRSGMMAGAQCGVGVGGGGAAGLVPPPPVPGQVTIQVRVPYRVVGLVVGPKGATIKRIQQQTSTYIVTPSREKEPIFEVTGMPDSVEQARKEIESHIAMRTGLVSGMEGGCDGLSPDMLHDLAAGLNGLGLGGMLGSSTAGLDGQMGGDLISSLYKTQSMRTAFTSGHQEAFGSGMSNLLGDNQFGLRSTSSTTNPFSSAIGHKLDAELHQTLGSGLLNSLYDSDEGIGLGGSDSPTLGHSLIQPNIWSTDFGLSSVATTSATVPVSSGSSQTAKRSNSFGFSASPELTEPTAHPPARRISSDPLTAIGSTLSSLSAAFQMKNNDSDSGHVRDSGSSSASGSASPTTGGCCADDSPGSSNSSTRGSLKQRECIMCCEGEIVAALVPCGHKFFCMDCAQRLASSAKADAESADSQSAAGSCPVCHETVTHAIRIIS